MIALLGVACHPRGELFVNKGNVCNSVGRQKWKIKIYLTSDSTYRINSYSHSYHTNYKWQRQNEKGNWYIDNDTVTLYSQLLDRKLVLIDKRYLCYQQEVNSIKKLGQKDRHFILNSYLSYQKRLF